jgi:hypothetical protein
VCSPDAGVSCALDAAAGPRVYVAVVGGDAASSSVDAGFPGDDATLSPIGVACRRRSAAFAEDEGALPIPTRRATVTMSSLRHRIALVR